MATHKNYSEATAIEIDTEIRRIVDDNYAKVKQLIKDNLESLNRIANALIEKENLTGAEVDDIIKSVTKGPSEVSSEA
jgi:cell division protease FtsH